MRREIGVLLIVISAIVGAVGGLWALLAIVGREWDYCARGDCIAGEAVGGLLVGVAAILVWFGFRLVRTG